MQQVKWNPSLSNTLIVQTYSDGQWSELATIKDSVDAIFAYQYCKDGAESWIFGKEFKASDFRIVNYSGEQIKLIM